MKIKLNFERERKIMLASDTQVGDLMQVVESGFSTHILLHAYNRFISLTNPIHTFIESCNLEVELLEPNESVTLTQE